MPFKAPLKVKFLYVLHLVVERSLKYLGSGTWYTVSGTLYTVDVDCFKSSSFTVLNLTKQC